MDPENQVVTLCVAGMQAEQAGRLEDARRLFARAWAAHQDPYEACIAAHYVARHQEEAASVLHWNQLALDYADAVGDERVAGFYPSLYLNLGWSHEQLGNWMEAQRYYDLAAEGVDLLPAGSYREVVAQGVAAGRERLGAGNRSPAPTSHRTEGDS